MGGVAKERENAARGHDFSFMNPLKAGVTLKAGISPPILTKFLERGNGGAQNFSIRQLATGVSLAFV